MDFDELRAKLRALGDISEDQRKKVVCTLIGHSNIMTTCFGYHYCGRCEAQLGDSLGSAYGNDKAVYVGHNCETCRTNFRSLTWRDTFLAPDPFAVEEVSI